MKITAIQIQNFLGARAVDLQLAEPVTLIAGKNGSGKSSIRDAVALALTADLGRVSLKKEAGNLVSEGTESGFVEIVTAADTYGVAITAAGKVSDTMSGKETPPALPYVLDAQRFARMDDKERRTFLFGLMGVKMDGATIKERLTVRGCNADKAEQIMPILRAGFDAASKEAAAKARDAKASWKTITGGETWGKDKAAKWKPAPLPENTDKAGSLYENAVARMRETEQELSAAQQALGAAKAKAQARQQAAAQRDELTEKAGRIERIKDKLERDEAEANEWQAKVNETRAKASGAPVNPEAPGQYLLRGLANVTDDFLTIAQNNPGLFEDELIHRAQAHLAEYKKLHGWPHSTKDQAAQPDHEAAAKLPEYEKSLALMQSAVANDKRDLAAAEQAAARLQEMDKETAETIDPQQLQAKVTELTEKRDNWRADVDKYKTMADQAASRQAVIMKAAILHADVLAWTDIADALAPDGIPGEILAEALGPINERLAHSANEAQWARINIGADMSIFAAEEGAQPRAYALLSESEKWRADAMIAEAVSFLANVKLLVLDRFDVLDMQGREDLLYWLDGLAQDGDIQTALLFGTLKSLPAKLPGHIGAHWIEHGVAGQIKQAA